MPLKGDTTMSNEQEQSIPRATGLLIIAAENVNPNGDPDRESDPRQRSHDRRGYISGVSFNSSAISFTTYILLTRSQT